jgi:hypothetical protein
MAFLARFAGAQMKDMRVHLEKLRSDAAECGLIPDLAIDAKRELCARLAVHLETLAIEVARAMAVSLSSKAASIGGLTQTAPHRGAAGTGEGASHGLSGWLSQTQLQSLAEWAGREQIR